jgi:hypothetical protein
MNAPAKLRDAMTRPDFTHTDLNRLEDRDLKYIIENFPLPGRNYEEIARLVDTLPTTLDSLLNSEYLYTKIYDQRQLILEISPFLFFNVLLRRVVSPQQAPKDRRIINYIANLLSIFIKTDRMHRVQHYDTQNREYMFELIQEAATADSRRQFLIYSHIGNYTLFITGLFPEWIRYRYRFKNRPMSIQHYMDYGRTYFQRAAQHRMAEEYNLDDVFFRMSMMFEHYKNILNCLARNYLFQS